jgi:meso-butanediol dehydrogenase / (S,S)-butanediol dehydrogenase / diacetyl reductase
MQGKVAIVTGGAQGIGRAIADGLAAAGARIVIADLHGAEEAAAAFPDGVGITADVSSEDDVERLVHAVVERCGTVDVLVNNAGLYAGLRRGAFHELDEGEWDRVMTVNVKGTWLCASACLPVMREQGAGSIVNIASTTAINGSAGFAHYVASKGAVIALTRAMAIDHVRQGVRVNAVCPGTVDSPWVRRLVEEVGESLDALRARQPMGRLGTTEEVAQAVLYLASDAAAFITGTGLVIDGGLTAA